MTRTTTQLHHRLSLLWDMRPIAGLFRKSMVYVILLFFPLATTANSSAETNNNNNTTTTTTASSPLEIGMSFCVEGYIMDYLCIQRGKLLDAPEINTLKGPDEHTVHCLIDVGVCIGSPYEVLLDPIANNGWYDRGFRLSDTAKSQAITIAKEVGFCNDCTGNLVQRGFRAAFEATVVDLGSDDIPPTIDASRVIPSNYGNNNNNSNDPCQEIGLPKVMDVIDREKLGLRMNHPDGANDKSSPRTTTIGFPLFVVAPVSVLLYLLRL